jgi:hypothetical protein
LFFAPPDHPIVVTAAALDALALLKSAPRHRVHAIASLRTRDDICLFIEGLDWTQPHTAREQAEALARTLLFTDAGDARRAGYVAECLSKRGKGKPLPRSPHRRDEGSLLARLRGLLAEGEPTSKQAAAAGSRRRALG